MEGPVFSLLSLPKFGVLTIPGGSTTYSSQLIMKKILCLLLLPSGGAFAFRHSGQDCPWCWLSYYMYPCFPHFNRLNDAALKGSVITSSKTINQEEAVMVKGESYTLSLNRKYFIFHLSFECWLGIREVRFKVCWKCVTVQMVGVQFEVLTT